MLRFKTDSHAEIELSGTRRVQGVDNQQFGMWTQENILSTFTSAKLFISFHHNHKDKLLMFGGNGAKNV